MKKYFDEQPTTRPEQVGVIMQKLREKFRRKYPTLDDVPEEWVCYCAPNPYDHAETTYTYMELYRFIRIEDNSLIGFRTRCPASFRNDD